MGLDHINMIDKIVKRITQCFSFRKCGKRVNLKGQKCINVMNDMDCLQQNIASYLKADFEKELFDAVFVNLHEKGNKLRLNNFAYATRELTRHFLSRLAPDKDVLNAPWFIPNDPPKPKAITREQRIRYAILGYLDETFARDTLQFDFTHVSKDLRKSIGDLSKYTHVNPETFNVDEDKILELTLDILESTAKFFKTISEAKIKIMKAVYNAVDEDMINKFYMETYNEIDMLATHHEILSYTVTSQKEVSKNNETITIRADGVVNVRLQYGSDGDMRRGDGYETQMDFPFTSEFIVNYKNQNGNIYIESAEIKVDNNSFFE